MNRHDPRAQTITADLRTVYAGLHRLSVPVWLQLDLTMAQFKALIAVEQNAGIPVCRLGRELRIGESATSLLVDQLVRRGYVERGADASDRRRVLLAATPRGAKLLGELRHGSDQSLKEGLGHLSDDALDALAKGLGALAGALSPDKIHATDDAAAVRSPQT